MTDVPLRMGLLICCCVGLFFLFVSGVVVADSSVENDVSTSISVDTNTFSIHSQGDDITRSERDLDSSNSDDNRSLGAEISSFMQASSVSTASTVDAKMFDASLTRLDENETTALITARTDRLETRFESIEENYQSVETNADQSPTTSTVAQRMRLYSELINLERSLDATDERASATAVKTDRLEQLRTSVTDLREGEFGDHPANTSVES